MVGGTAVGKTYIPKHKAGLRRSQNANFKSKHFHSIIVVCSGSVRSRRLSDVRRIFRA